MSPRIVAVAASGAREQAVDVDDRDARLLGLLGDRRERRAVLRQHDERVGLLRDRLLDLLRLRVGVRRLEQLEVDVVVLVGRGLGVLRDRAEPAVVGRRDAGDDPRYKYSAPFPFSLVF